jgi:hypothetical protein
VRGSADVLAPDGTHPLDIGQALQVRSWALPEAGFYSLTLADSRHDLVAANISRLESDLTPAGDDKLKLWQAASNGAGPQAPGTTAVTGAAPATSDESVHNLWWYAMCLALLAVLAESLVASRYLNTLRESS